MEKLERYLQFMREAERLKNVLRSARTSTGRHESTAEHTWRLALLALVLADEKPELDLPRVLAMALDKAETILQHNQGANPADFDYEFNLTYGAEWFRDDALLRRLRRLLDAETARHAGR